MSIAPDYTTPAPAEDLPLRVSLSSAAGRVNLWPNKDGNGFKLHMKADSLGVADSENTMTAVSSGGAIMRHQRLKEGDMFLPIQIRSNSKKARNDLKSQLEAVLVPAKGPVRVEVRDPYSGDTRSRVAYYRTGLGAPDWSGPVSALYGITLDYAQPWWRGADRGRRVKVAERKKAFITNRFPAPAPGAQVHKESRVPTSSDAGSEGDVWYVGANAEPEKVLRRNLATNPSFETTVSGLEHSQRNATLSRSGYLAGVTSGDQCLKLTLEGAAASNGFAIQNDISTEGVEAGKWVAFGLDATASELGGATHICPWVDIRQGQTVVARPALTFDALDTSARRFSRAVQVPEDSFDNIRVVARFHGSGNGAAPADGDVYTDSWAVAVGDTEAEAESKVGSFLDGDTEKSGSKHYRWTGTPHDSTSEEYTPATDFKPTARYIHNGTKWEQVGLEKRAPFFPVFVYSSVVEGVYTLQVEGDEPAWPTWTINGPGKDLLIENMTTGESLFIEGEIFEPVTIVTDEQNQSIHSETRPHGEWWQQIDVKQGDLFPLAPGENKIKITMVGATQASYVDYRYEEIWKAPY